VKKCFPFSLFRRDSKNNDLRDNFSRCIIGRRFSLTSPPPFSLPPPTHHTSTNSHIARESRARHAYLYCNSLQVIYSSREFRLLVRIITNQVFLQTFRPTCWASHCRRRRYYYYFRRTRFEANFPTGTGTHTHTHIMYTHVA